jgi:hypothetical protein
MPLPPEVAEREKERFLKRVAQLRASSEEQERLLSASAPFDWNDWLQDAKPATSEELAEMEEFLQEREEERRRSLAAEEAPLSEGG